MAQSAWVPNRMALVSSRNAGCWELTPVMSAGVCVMADAGIGSPDCSVKAAGPGFAPHPEIPSSPSKPKKNARNAMAPP